MSAPFDPSKLDLDINNPDSSNDSSLLEGGKKREVLKKTTQEKPVTTEETTSSENEDVLGEIQGNDSRKDMKEGASLLGKEGKQGDIVKETETANSQDTEETPPLPKNEEIISDNDILSTSIITGGAAATSIASSLLSEKTKTQEDAPQEKREQEQRIIDINISSLDALARILIEDEYDFVTLEPSETEVKLSFRKNKVEKLVKYIKYPTYTNILLKTKQLTKMSVDPSEDEREAKGNMQVSDKSYDVIAKIAPSSFGEKIFLKMKENTTKKATKKVKKTSIGTIFGFLGSVLFVSLILGAAFITFIILNAQNVEDVKFFQSLGINLNDINTFISKVITFIFSLVLFIETVVLAIFLFKFSLTKKEFKRKRVMYGMVSTILLIVTFASASAWMIIDGKIKSLPNWQELAYGDIQIYDNDRLTSDQFDKAGSLITDTSNLIGPITIKYDLSLFESNEERKGFKVKKYIWDIGGEKIEELSPILIKEYIEKGNYEISLIVEEVDLKGELIEKEVDNIPSVSISHSVTIDEEFTKSGGKIIKFDALDLKQLGKIEWYFSDDLEKPVWEGYTFKPSKIFFEETVIALSIVDDEGGDNKTKVFVIGGESSTNIAGSIKYTQSLIDELKYTMSVENPETSFGDGFIEEFEWIIEGKGIIKKADPTNLEKSSEIEYNFKKFGKNEVSVILKDASGKTKELIQVINIPRKMTLRKHLDIWDNGEKLSDIRYLEKGNEYFVDELGVPTILKLDARFVRPQNLLYSLKEVSWDFGNNGSIDEKGKSTSYEVNTEGNHTVIANYKFIHRTIPDDIIILKEYIYIEGIKKEAVVNLKLEKDRDYVPVTVRFDASKSTIKNDDIVKFIYDYGDGVIEERDAINPGHKYTKAGDYKIKLTIVGKSGKRYSGEKSLILKPEPQGVKLSVSLKKAPLGQGIDFSSEDSDGQITEYFWDFDDGETSVEANPTHVYNRVGIYKVKLRVDFKNKNSLTDEMEIEIYEE